MSELTTGGINFESTFAYRIDKEAVEEHDKVIRKSFEKAFAIEELEKIKIEIIKITFRSVATGKTKEEMSDKIVQYLDKRISELKGENNDL